MKSFNPQFVSLPVDSEPVAGADQVSTIQDVEQIEVSLRQYLDHSLEAELKKDLGRVVTSGSDDADKDLSEVQSLHLDAQRLLAAGESEAALVLITQARGVDPSSLSLISTKIEILIDLGRIDEAIDAATVASSLHDDNPESFSLLARLWMTKSLSEDGKVRQNSLLLADQYSGRAFELGANDVLSYLEAASIAILRSNQKDAEAHLLRAVAADPFHPMANFLLGELALVRQEWAKAESYLAEAALGESQWQEPARQLLRRLEKVGFNTPVMEHGPLYNFGLWVGRFGLGCLVAIVPTLFFWVAVDTFTGYFPSVGLIAFSVPVGPILAFVASSLAEHFKFEKAKLLISQKTGEENVHGVNQLHRLSAS